MVTTVTLVLGKNDTTHDVHVVIIAVVVVFY